MVIYIHPSLSNIYSYHLEEAASKLINKILIEKRGFDTNEDEVVFLTPLGREDARFITFVEAILLNLGIKYRKHHNSSMEQFQLKCSDLLIMVINDNAIKVHVNKYYFSVAKRYVPIDQIAFFQIDRVKELVQ